MSDPTNPPAGDDVVPGGNDDQKPDVVKRDAFDKLLGEKKKADEARRKAEARAKELEDKEAEREQARLKEQGKHEELAAAEKKRADALEAQLKEQKQQQDDQNKVGAVVRSLGTVKSAYLNVIGDRFIDKIKMNDDGTLDEASLKATVDEFKRTFPEAVATTTSGVPTPNPRGSGGKLSYEEWLTLPAKEKRERMKEVI